MVTTLLFPQVAGVRVPRVWREEVVLHLEVVTTRRAARCPLCRRRSKRKHSAYWRTVADLPCGGEPVVVHLRVRRFVCPTRGCRRHIFAERLPDLVAPFARRTTRLTAQVRRTGFDVGGDPGVRHLAAEGVRVSARTVLRLLRATPLPLPGPVRVVGVDDFARRRGRTYATILVDLETHTTIDLLPDREAATVAAWLAQHPEVEVISRDRAGAYAEGARVGAPQAIQVADRWHLLKNLTDAVERALSRRHQLLHLAAEAVLRDTIDALPAPVVPAPSTDAFPTAPLERGTPGRTAAQERRAARHAAVQDLRRAGVSLTEVARRLHLTRTTVRTLAQAETCPDRVPHDRILAPFEPSLRHRWAQGCRNADVLCGELQARGYGGSASHLRHALRAWRDQPARRGRAAQGSMPAAPQIPPLRPVSPHRAAWLLQHVTEDRAAEDQAFMAHLLTLCPAVRALQDLAQSFGALLRGRDSAALSHIHQPNPARSGLSSNW